MVNVQLEHGYTRIANQILENIVKLPLSGTQWRIIAILWRNTYGYSRKEHGISETYIAKATGISKRFISSELKKLIEMNIIRVVKESTYTTPRVLMFNKNYDAWGYGTILPQVNDTSTGEQVFTSTVEQSFTSTGEQSFHQQKKNSKKELKKNTAYPSDFEKFYSEYPRPEDKRRTYNNWRTCLKTYTVEQLMAACRNYKSAKAGTEKQYLKTSANFLGREKPFEDYLPENYQENEVAAKPKYNINQRPEDKYF